MARGPSPLYGFISTTDLNGNSVIVKTKGHTQGYKSLTAKLATNHGAIQVTIRENGDVTASLIPWKSEEGKYRGVRKEILDDNFRNIEDRRGRLSPDEHQAHLDFAEAQ